MKNLLNLFSSSTNKSAEFQAFYEQFDQILAAARQLYTESETLKKIIHEQAGAVQASSGANQEISSMVSKTAENAASLAEISNSSVQAINQGQAEVQAMNNTLTQMQEVSHKSKVSIESSFTELQEIADYMKQIQTKTHIINEIAFQTKILAFNASVEAARAGEHGKGFAVVASEMSSLANSSGNAAKEIETILKESISKTNEKTQAISERLQHLTSQIESQVHQMEEKGQTVNLSFQSMTSAAQSTSSMSDEISSATREQELGIKEVLQALSHLDQISMQLTSVADSAFKTSFNLAERTENLGKKLIELSQMMGVQLSIVHKHFDFTSAINAHIDWKMKLSKYLEKPDGSLKADHVCKDNVCILGKWLYGDGSHFQSQFPSVFTNLKGSHAEFHKTAGEVIRLIESNNTKAAVKLLSPDGAYAAISSKTVALINELKGLVESLMKNSQPVVKTSLKKSA
jgi:methyl-accepting chemotaxis protein